MTFHAALPPWLLKAVEQAGDATVILKPGDRPFVIKSKAPYHLSTQPMTNLGLEGLAQQILSEDGQQALYNGQSVEETLTGERIPVSVRAVRLDHDIVIKLRNAQTPEDASVAVESVAPIPEPAAPAVDEVAAALEEETRVLTARFTAPVAPVAAPEPEPPAEIEIALEDEIPVVAETPVRPAAVIQNAGGEVIVENAGREPVAEIALPTSVDEVDTFISTLAPATFPSARKRVVQEDEEEIEIPQPVAAVAPQVPVAVEETPAVVAQEPEYVPQPQAIAAPEPEYVPQPQAIAVSEPEYVPQPMTVAAPESENLPRPHANVSNSPNVTNDSNDDYVAPTIIQRPKAVAKVVDMGRRRALAVATADLGDWIKEAMDRSATALYLRSGKAPSARIDGRVETLASEPLPMEMFERAGGVMTSGADGWRDAGEWAWSRDIAGAGTVRCQAFSDGQGGGFIVQLPVSVAGLDQQVPRHIRTACEAGEGLVVISAPFAEDVAAMVGAVVAWNAQRRAGFVVAFGAGGGLQSVAGDAFVSERPMPANDHDMAAALQAALRERPDTLVFIGNDSLPGADAIVAAAVGRLVIVGVVARTAPRALEVLLKELGPNRRALAAAFRGACSWRGFRRPGGQRIVIADALVPGERVSALIEAADIAGLHAAQTNREDGMRALDMTLAAAVTRRKITLREAAACAVDRKALITLVRRQAWEARAAERAEQRASHRAPVLSMTGA